MNDDQHLDDLLKGVKVPTGLRQRLKNIPLRSIEPEESTFEDLERMPRAIEASTRPKIESLRRRWSIAVAVVLLIGFFGLTLRLMQRDTELNNPDQAAKGSASSNLNGGKDSLQNPANHESPESLAAAIAECDRQMEELKRQLSGIEERKLRMQVERAERQWMETESARQFKHERASLVLALSAESALKFGLAADKVKADLQNVIERFPNSTGAERAMSLLNQLN